MSEETVFYTNQYTEQIRGETWKTFARGVKRDKGNFCELCKRSDVQLTVHHWCYEKDRRVCDYSLQELAVLCWPCHQALHARLNEFRRYVFPRLGPRAFQVLNGALAAALTRYDGLTVAYALAEIISTEGALRRLCDAWLKRSASELPMGLGRAETKV